MKKVLLILLSLFIMVGISRCLTGCATQQSVNKKVHRKAEKAKKYLKDNYLLPKICAEEFPIKTEYIKGDSIVHFDTLYVDGVIYDTVVLNDTVYITRSLPGKVINKTIRITDTVVKENTARVAALQIEIDALNAQKAVLELQLKVSQDETQSWKTKARKRQWLIYAICGGIVVFIGFKLRKSIFSLFK